MLVGYRHASSYLPWKTCGIYLGILLLQFVVVRQAAATYGARFVRTVRAQKAIKPAR
jgi:hypothetical protein